jgi:hypothetical protein
MAIDPNIWQDEVLWVSIKPGVTQNHKYPMYTRLSAQLFQMASIHLMKLIFHLNSRLQKLSAWKN